MSGPDPIDEWIAICADQHAELERLRAEKAELLKTINAIYSHTANAVDEYTCASLVARIETICRTVLAKEGSQ